MSDSIEISAELTPNPNTLKFVVQRELIPSGSFDFPTRESAEGQPLPSGLFGIEYVAGVLIGTDFITVTKRPDVEWPVAAVPVVDKIREFLKTGEPVIDASKIAAPFQDRLASLQASSGEPGGIESKIRQILDAEIRPAVARDGGDIVFYGYEDGVVKLHLQGSCSSCPSSIMTLKVGIENRLKMSFPEIKEVIQV